MQRKHLIVIAVAVFVCAACACSGLVAAVLLWPSETEDATTKTRVTEWTPPRVPEVDSIDEPSYTRPRVDGQSPTPSRSQSALDFLPGVWLCVQGSTQVGEGCAIQFMESAGGAAGLAYLSSDPSSESSWTELSYQLGVEGYLTVYPTQVPEGRAPVTTRLWVQFPEATTMLMYSAEPGDESLPPAVMQRVQ